MHKWRCPVSRCKFGSTGDTTLNDESHSAEYEKFKDLLENPAVISWRAILEAQRTIFAQLESCLQKEGFTVARFQIMFFLYFKGPLAPSTVADLTAVSRGNITAFFKRMLADDLIETVTGRSEARPKYTLTSNGRREFEKIFPQHVERVSKLVLPLEQPMIDQLQKAQLHARDASITLR